MIDAGKKYMKNEGKEQVLSAEYQSLFILGGRDGILR
jgi:hypothetical protein